MCCRSSAVASPRDLRSTEVGTRFSVHPGVRMGARMVASLGEKTGRNLEEWIVLLESSGPAEEKERIAWLKSEYGLGTNYAGVLAEAASGRGRARWDPEVYLAVVSEYVDAQYAGKNGALRPVYERLVEVGVSLGEDVTLSPTKTFVPLYRNRVFAQIKPTTLTRVDLGLALGDTPTDERLLDTGGLAKGDRITRRIALTAPDEVDAVIERWLVLAYELDE